MLDGAVVPYYTSPLTYINAYAKMYRTDSYNKLNKERMMRIYLKYFILTLICLSALAGGIAQIIAWNSTVLQYNAYFQLVLGFGLFVWLSHKLISRYEVRVVKPITNARDTK